MRASLRMAKEGANSLIKFRADDVLELAGLGVRFGVGNRESVLEEALRKTMAADNIAGPAASYGRKLRFAVL